MFLKFSFNTPMCLFKGPPGATSEKISKNEKAVTFSKTALYPALITLPGRTRTSDLMVRSRMGLVLIMVPKAYSTFTDGAFWITPRFTQLAEISSKLMSMVVQK